MAEPFRWQALFQRASEPLFLLDRQRRIRFVNAAWEALTGLPAAEARGLVCRRRREVEPGTPEAVAHALAPSPEVLTGQAARVRRLVAGSRWWDVEFFPLRDEQGVCGILGKVVAEAAATAAVVAALPEKLLALRERLSRRYSLDSLLVGLPTQRRLADQVRLASQTRASVLILGEPGTGKEWTARVIHHQGTSRPLTFAALDCAGLPPAAVAAALFGSAGLVRRPNLGTLYLAEIPALPRELQDQLSGRLAEPDSPGPRIIAGVSADPAEEIRSGRLLPDLHAALATLVLTLSPLRERRADLPVLVKNLLEKRTLAADAWEVVRAYRWPGNLAELSAVLMTALGHAKADAIEAPDLPAYVRQAVRLDQEPGRTPERPLPLVDLLQQVERRLITLALRMAKGNKSRAAEILVLTRGSLLNRMERLGIEEE